MSGVIIVVECVGLNSIRFARFSYCQPTDARVEDSSPPSDGSSSR